VVHIWRLEFQITHVIILITQRLWSSTSPYLNLCDYLLEEYSLNGLWLTGYGLPDFQIWVCGYCMWGTIKEWVYVNSPHYLQKVKDSVLREISSISQGDVLDVGKYF
jgi:hypothetical protein